MTKRLSANPKVSTRTAALLGELEARGMLRHKRIKNPNPGRSEIKAFYVIGDTYELLPLEKKPRTTVEPDLPAGAVTGKAPTEVLPAPAQAPSALPDAFLGKCINDMTLTELRRAHQFLNRMFG